MKGKSKKLSSKHGKKAVPDLGEISGILTFMEEHHLEEFEYENGATRIRLRKAQSHASIPFHAVQPAPEIIIPRPVAPSVTSDAPSGSTPVTEPGDKNLHVIKSPIVGTFYASPNPSAEPFIHTGDHVEAGQVLCIIEAMKLMNEIEADVAGEVMRIFVENGQPVEYGEPLFSIHPSRKQ